MNEEKEKGRDVMRLVGRLSHLFREEMRRACFENGLPLGYRSLLFHLGRCDGQTQRELAEKTGLRPATVSVTVDKMERDGYVTRQKDAFDRRVFRVLLTEKGKETDRSNREKVETLEKQYSGLISPAEREQLAALLTKIIEGCERRREDAGCRKEDRTI